MQVEKPAQPRVPGVGQWFPPHLFRQVLRSRARLAALPLVLPGPLTHTLRSTFAPLCGPSRTVPRGRAGGAARPGALTGAGAVERSSPSAPDPQPTQEGPAQASSIATQLRPGGQVLGP